VGFVSYILLSNVFSFNNDSSSPFMYRLRAWVYAIQSLEISMNGATRRMTSSARCFTFSHIAETIYPTVIYWVLKVFMYRNRFFNSRTIKTIHVPPNSKGWWNIHISLILFRSFFRMHVMRQYDNTLHINHFSMKSLRTKEKERERN